MHGCCDGYHAMGEIICTFAMLVFDATCVAFGMLYHGLMSVFSARHRAEFIQEWRRSAFSKFALVLFTGVNLVWIVAVGWMWINFVKSMPEPESEGNTLTLLNKVVTLEDRKALLNTEKVEDLTREGAKMAIDKFKSTWKFRSSNQEAKGEDARVSQEGAAQPGSE